MIRVIAGLVSLVASSACLALEHVSVQLVWKHQFEFAAFYAAKQQGYYREAGLEVDIREGGPGLDAVRDVAEGRTDFGVGTSGLVVDRYEGKPVVALAALMQHSPIALLAKRRQGVSSVLDLADRPVAVDHHNRDEIEAYLRASGIPPQKIKLVPQTDWTLESLETGQHAAKVVYVSNEPYWIRRQAHDYLLLTPRSAGIDLFGNLLFTSEDFLRKHENTVRAFRAATLKGLAYALEHPEEIANLILRQYNTQDKSLAHLLFEADQLRELTRPDIVEPGYMSPGRWRHVVEVYASQGKMPAHFRLEDFLYDPTPQPTPAWVIWAIGLALAGMAAALVVAYRVRLLNSALRGEVRERQHAEAALLASEAKYRELVDNANAIIVRLAPDGTVVFFNEVAEKVFGFTAQEIMHRSLVGTIVPEIESGSSRDLSNMVAELLADPARFADNQNENITKDGRRIWIRWANRVIPGADNQPADLLCIGHDITEQHRLELELAHYRNNLEEQVLTRTMELEDARHEAERLAQVKSIFLANMSHEIRTPLNGVLGFAQLGYRANQGREKAQKYFARIIDSSKLLLGIINDILDFSKLDAGHVRMEHAPFELKPILTDPVALLTPQAENKGIDLDLSLSRELPTHCMGDPLRLQQVLLNLLSNAIKFTERGRVRLTAGLTEHQGHPALQFSVTDTGIGIPADQQAHLFDAFTQGDTSTTRRFGGTGLGLAISKRLVDQMAGEIDLESTPGVGSTFRVRIPYHAVPLDTPFEALGHSQPVRIYTPEKKLQGIKVLVAEDNPVNQAVLEELLQEEGCELLITDNGQEALDAVRTTGVGAFQIVLMDVQMPVMNGLDATRAIHAIDPTLPIVGQTAHALQEEREKCRQAGMVTQLIKPLDPDLLVEAILKWARPAP